MCVFTLAAQLLFILTLNCVFSSPFCPLALDLRVCCEVCPSVAEEEEVEVEEEVDSTEEGSAAFAQSAPVWSSFFS